MPHRNAPLTPTGRLRPARCVVEEGWSLRRAAERFQVSATTAKRWADRYRQLGEAGMHDRTRPPASQPPPDAAGCRGAGARSAPGAPHRSARPARTGIAPSTAHRILVRHGVAPPGGMRPGHRRARPPLASTSAPGTWSISTSRSSAASPTRADTRCRACRGPR
ncbi:hypothetical protein GCM10022416_09260 [Actinomadura keratinilytica]|uniref:Insertion element IS150 protein InsJ-like helix-turn-helix domain-containing protein n=1 Tax=Actinomadura keratinilytica TaxID=547461 RepID=A0ABP7Y5C9_9ACTN